MSTKQRKDYAVKPIDNGWILEFDTPNETDTSRLFFPTELEAFEQLALIIGKEIDLLK